ncbi:MAG TPA: STAUR_1299 family protein [Bryobacteraceae bacterium]|nr:STAUR_1299 family protein [Bryobacteraceae bacterium]
MAAYLDVIAAKAFRTVPGIEYNRTLAELTEGGKNPDRLVFYEVALGEGKSWEWLRDHLYPAFVRYLKDKDIPPEDPQRVVVPVFHKDRCFLLTGRAFLDVFKEIEGLNDSAFHFRVLKWLAI